MNGGENLRYTHFGKEVRKAMIDKDITSKQLAEELGISTAYLTEILRGTRKAKKQKKRIVDFLGLECTILS